MGATATDLKTGTRLARTSDPAPHGADAPEVSIVMPCLNEAETLPACISKAQQVLRENGLSGEVIVADNGSTDGSAALAAAMGARVVHVKLKGYGSALRGGIAAARGKYIITADSDGSHDLTQIPQFLFKLREGFDLVVGNRLKGGIERGAMGALHRYVGNPALSGIARLFFRTPCGDILCGLRGIRRAAYSGIQLRRTGFDFDSEIFVKAAELEWRVTELPTKHSASGRSRAPHLHTWRDGWQLLVLMLLHSPRWLFLYPGVALVLLGLLLGAWSLPGLRAAKSTPLEIHGLLWAVAAEILGFQSIAFAAFAKLYAIGEGLLPEGRKIESFLGRASLELGLTAGSLLVAGGLAASVYAVGIRGAQHSGDPDPFRAIWIIVSAVLLLVLGGQIILSSFFLSILRLGRDSESPPAAGAKSELSATRTSRPRRDQGTT